MTLVIVRVNQVPVLFKTYLVQIDIIMYKINHFSFVHSDDVHLSSVLTGITLLPFQGIAGPKVPIPSSPPGVFSLFFTSTLLQYIVDQSNQFALECMGADKFASWTKITVEELQAYMGFMILMGLVKLPSIFDYWKKDETFHYSSIASRITRTGSLNSVTNILSTLC